MEADFAAAVAAVFPGVAAEVFRVAAMAAAVIAVVAAAAFREAVTEVEVTRGVGGVRRSVSGAVLVAAPAWVAATLLAQAAADAIVFPLHIFRVAIFRGRQRVRGQAAAGCHRAERNGLQLALVHQLVEARPSYRPEIVKAREQERGLHKNLRLEPNQRAAKLEPNREANLLSCQQKAAVTFSARRLLPGLALA